MNDVATTHPTQLCRPLPKLRPAQAELYELIIDACTEKKQLDMNKSFEVYKKHAAGKGWCYYAKHDDINHQWIGAEKVWSDWHWKLNFRNWLLRALGALICKGYLTVLPAINFNDIRISGDANVSTAM